MLLNIKWAFLCPLQILSANFLILRRTERNMIKYVYWYTIIIPTKCTRFLLLKSQDITICNFVLYFCPYMFQPAWIIFRGLNASAWLKLLLITIY
jgi:hypothetical protein